MKRIIAFVILLALAITSTRGWIKRLGARWISLHRAVYAAGALAVLHHFWLVKADYRPAIVHGVLLAGLLTARLAWQARSRAARSARAGAGGAVVVTGSLYLCGAVLADHDG